MAELFIEPVGPDQIDNLREMYYDTNGELIIDDAINVSGWDLIAQELRIMFISNEETIGSDSDLAIDIRQYADRAADMESAEIIQDWIETKIYANPVIAPLDIIVEMVPLDNDSFEIVFKRPYIEDPTLETYVDLDFKIGVDAVRGVITELLDDISTAGDLYITNPILVTEYREIKTPTNILSVNYTPVDTEPVLLYNKDDILVINGSLIVQTEDIEITLDVLPRRTYSIIDFTDYNLERAVIESYSLEDESQNVIEEGKYTLVGTNLVIPTNSDLSGTHILKLTVSQRYANVKSLDKIDRTESNLFVYPYLRTSEHKIVFDRSLKNGTYLLQYYVYGDRT